MFLVCYLFSEYDFIHCTLTLIKERYGKNRFCHVFYLKIKPMDSSS